MLTKGCQDSGCSRRGTHCVLTKPLWALWLSRSTPSQPRWLICARSEVTAGSSTCGGNGASIWGPANKANLCKCPLTWAECEAAVRGRLSDVYIAITAVAAVTAAARRPRAQEENRVLLNHACEAAQFVKSLWLVAGVYVVVNF